MDVNKPLSILNVNPMYRWEGMLAYFISFLDVIFPVLMPVPWWPFLQEPYAIAGNGPGGQDHGRRIGLWNQIFGSWPFCVSLSFIRFMARHILFQTASPT